MEKKGKSKHTLNLLLGNAEFTCILSAIVTEIQQEKHLLLYAASPCALFLFKPNPIIFALTDAQRSIAYQHVLQ